MDLSGAVPKPSAGGKHHGKSLGRRKRAPSASSITWDQQQEFPIHNPMLRGSQAQPKLGIPLPDIQDQNLGSISASVSSWLWKRALEKEELKINDNKFPKSEGAEPCSEPSRTNVEG